jgi:hypothetical protein
MQMTPNPITEEIRSIRHQLAAEQGNDVSRIGAELRRRQAISGRRVVRLAPRNPDRRPTNNPMHPSGGSDVSGMDASSPAAG